MVESSPTVAQQPKQGEQRAAQQSATVADEKSRQIQQDEQWQKIRILRKKLVFTGSIASMALIIYFIGFHPEYLLKMYLIQGSFLMVLRLFWFTKLKWQYFILDFCYFANALVALNILVYRHSPLVAQVAFALAHGPILWAVVVWRNSLVFHSLDKMTTVFIHVMPALVTYTIRWQSIQPEFTLSEEVDNSGSFFNLYFAPVIFHCTWQVLYSLRVYVWKAKEIEAKGLLTSYNWTVNSDCWSGNFIKKFPKMYRPVIFALMNTLYVIITLIPTKLLWDNKHINLASMSLLLLAAVWNGAGYYFTAFPKEAERESQDKVRLQTEALVHPPLIKLYACKDKSKGKDL